MPAKAPHPGEMVAARLEALGRRIRAHRKRLGVTATSAAEAAGMSRVTLHRIERGLPSVAMGAYMSAVAALGLELGVADPQEHRAESPGPSLPARIRLNDFAELARLAWQHRGVDEVTPEEALNLYERNWRHIDPGSMAPDERALVRSLAAALGAGRLLV